MNAIRQTALLNKRELENAIPPSASWHVDYRDTAWIYVGGLPLDLSEGDVVTIFSQFGNPTHLNMIRDKETGKTKGFGFLKYEDQRSCDLAVDNLGGADVLGRLLRVDHTRYKRKEGEDEDTYRIERMEAEADGNGNRKRASDTEEESEGDGRAKKRRKMLKEERELQEMLAIKQDGAEEDPMRDYLIREKREEVGRARDKEEKRHKHKHRHHHRLKEEVDGAEGGERKHRNRHRPRSRSPDDNEEDRAVKKRRKAESGTERESGRRRSISEDRDSNGYKRERRRPRSSRSPSPDGHWRTKHRSRSPKRSRYDDSD